MILNAYEEEIDRGYADLANASVVELDSPEKFGLEECHLFLSQLVEQIMGRELGDDDDFFLCGCDRFVAPNFSRVWADFPINVSLKATWMRNNLLNVLRSMDVNTESIPVNFVYLYPTINRLSQYLSSAADGHQADPAQETIQRMNDLVEKYSTGFVQHKPVFGASTETETVLLTGSTGGLGSYILEYLIQDEAVSKIYCLNRKGRTTCLERQKLAFRNRGIDTTSLDSDKLVFIEGESSLPYLGLSKEQYEEVQESVTSVLHVGKQSCHSMVT